MKKRLSDIFYLTRNERIGIICLIVVLGCVIAYKVLSPSVYNKPVLNEAIAQELISEIENAKVDTIKIPKKERQRNKPNKEAQPPITVESMNEI